MGLKEWREKRKDEREEERAEREYGQDLNTARDSRRFYGGEGNGVDWDGAARLNKKPAPVKPASKSRPHRPHAA